MNSEKRIVILTPGFPKDETDSTCLPMQQQLVKALKNRPGLDIIIVTFQYPFHRKTYQWHGITVIPFSGRNRGGLPRLVNRIKILSALKEIHRKWPITGVLSFWYGECAAVGKIFADRIAIRHYCWLLGQDVKKKNKYPPRVQLKQGELIAISDATAAEMKENHGVEPAYVIPPGINTRMFDKPVTEKTIDILGVGSLIPLKNYEAFVSVVVALKKNMPGIKAEIAGKGPDYKKLNELIIENDLQNNLVLTGELAYKDVLQRMQRAKLFLHPSVTEGFSGACMEALYAGAKVISFCKPMNDFTNRWHIVNSTEEMILKAEQLLHGKVEDHNNILLYDINETADSILKLFF